MGPRVFYRSSAAPGAAAGGLPVAIPGEARGSDTLDRRANVQIIILLVDAHLVADPAWRAWLERLGSSSVSFRRVFIPVALDSTAYNIPDPLRNLNFLRPSGLPMPEVGNGAVADAGRFETAALIVVRSARYAGRPWCRRELATFRRPRRERGSGGVERWRMYPTLVVEFIAGGEQSPGIPELGNSLCLRWEPSVADQEEKIVTTLLREVMLAAFHAAMGANLGSDLGREVIVLNWLPDPTSLLHIPRVRNGRGKLKVIHPGRGMSLLELDILSEFFPNITFQSFEDCLT